MNMVTVRDSGDNPLYTYDDARQITTADDGLAFFTSQLAFIESQIYETLYAPIIFQELIPITTSDPEWINQVDYFHFDSVTMGKFIGANGNDLPRADVTAGKSTIPVFYGGISFGYSLDELRVSQQTRQPVDTTKGEASRVGYLEHAQQVAYFGDSDYGVTGLYNNANVQSDNSTINWATATGQEIVTDMNSLLARVWSNSATRHIPNRLILPQNQFERVSSRRMDSGTDTTVLNYFLQNNIYTLQTGQPLDLRTSIQLNDAGAGSKPVMMAYEVNERNLTMRIPIEWRTTAPQMEGLQIVVPAEYKFGGVEFRYPGSAAYRTFL